ncbi:ABC-three component system middle component 6 [Lactobacillus sp. B3795]|uniref:ABC-three component system middle component 6 n=1 Tax=Lactobacillus sp. B3795 TaxID=2818036 RepID=UPI0034A05483
MIILDKNNNPYETVYYTINLSYKYIHDNDGIDICRLYNLINDDCSYEAIRYDFLLLSLDFLFYIDKITVNKYGGLHVYKETNN